MSPATAWTELTVPATPYTEGLTSIDTFDGFSLFVLPIPIFAGISFVDPTASWNEMTVSATSGTEMSVAATVWTELT